jgi:hypothetical protein
MDDKPLVLTKLIASRDQDLADINALLAANQNGLDLAWIEREWTTLFPLTDSRWLRLQDALTKYYEQR